MGSNMQKYCYGALTFEYIWNGSRKRSKSFVPLFVICHTSCLSEMWRCAKLWLFLKLTTQIIYKVRIRTPPFYYEIKMGGKKSWFMPFKQPVVLSLKSKAKDVLIFLWLSKNNATNSVDCLCGFLEKIVLKGAASHTIDHVYSSKNKLI